MLWYISLYCSNAGFYVLFFHKRGFSGFFPRSTPSFPTFYFALGNGVYCVFLAIFDNFWSCILNNFYCPIRFSGGTPLFSFWILYTCGLGWVYKIYALKKSFFSIEIWEVPSFAAQNYVFFIFIDWLSTSGIVFFLASSLRDIFSFWSEKFYRVIFGVFFFWLGPVQFLF